MLSNPRTFLNLNVAVPVKRLKFHSEYGAIAVAALTSHGHRVLIESGAGMGAKFNDKDYSEAGAEVTNDTKKVFSCPMILKVEPPSIDELEHVNPQTILISALQIKTQTKKYFETLAAKRITALAFEFIKDESGFSGNIMWDLEKPNGTHQKKLDISLISKLGWSHKISLIDGIRKTIKEFKETYF